MKLRGRDISVLLSTKVLKQTARRTPLIDAQHRSAGRAHCQRGRKLEAASSSHRRCAHKGKSICLPFRSEGWPSTTPRNRASLTPLRMPSAIVTTG